MTKVVVPVWDLPTRGFHWLLVASVVVSYASSGEHGWLFAVHTASGYMVGLLLLFRLVWGFLGSAHSRFADFVYGRAAVVGYAKQVARLSPPRFTGHNPLGGWMVIVMLVILATTVVTGLFSTHGKEAYGILFPLISRDGKGGLGEIHELLGNFVVILACVHVAGVVADWLLARDNLVRAMITGKKPLHPAAAANEPPLAPGWRAAVIAILVAAAGFMLFQNTNFARISADTGHGEQADEHGDGEDGDGEHED